MSRLTDSPAFRSWKLAWRRCYGKSDQSRYYRDAGITMHPRWHTFANFLADMGERPEGMTLDRIDTSKGYEPSNCRWADQLQQSRNRTCNNLLTYNGITACLSEWSERLGLERGTIPKRIKKGWPPEMVFRPKSVKSHVTGRKKSTNAKDHQ